MAGWRWRSGRVRQRRVESAAPPIERFAVVDTETTGLGPNDRVVEVAIVTLDGRGAMMDEWSTLLNVNRDVGPTHLHRIDAAAVADAPRFDQVAGEVIERLDGAVVVAHNLPFDVRMLSAECNRLGLEVSWGVGADTLRMTGRRLFDACDEHGVVLEGWHSALADARATAELFVRVGVGDGYRPVRAGSIPIRTGVRAKPREGQPASVGGVAGVAERLAHRGADARLMPYLDVVHRVVADRVVTDAERVLLDTLAGELGLTPLDQRIAHTRFVDDLVAALVVDGDLDPREEAEVALMASLLHVDPAVVDAHRMRFAARPPVVWDFRPGVGVGESVCFTGAAVDVSGRPIDRSELQALALRCGLDPVDSVTRRTTVVVAADTESRSGKVRKAYRYGIPVVSVDEFMRRCGGLTTS